MSDMNKTTTYEVSSFQQKTVTPALTSVTLPREMQPMLVFPLMDHSTRGQGTVKPAASFDPKVDAEHLSNALKGFGTDKKLVLRTLCNRTNAQRQLIASTYKTMFGKDLIKELSHELTGKFELVITALMIPPADYEACELHNAMSGLGTDDSVLIEILCSRTPAEITLIKESYLRMYNKELEKAIQGDTTGHFKRLLVSLCTAGRNEEFIVDRIRAVRLADDLFRAGVSKWGTDECVFNSILCAENYAQLQVIFVEYQKIAKHDIEDAITKEFSGDLQKGLLAVVKCIRNKPAYFAERLHHAMSGFGTKDRTLVRIIVSRSEIDLVQIKQEFFRMFGETLEKWIEADTSGKYEDALLALITGM